MSEATSGAARDVTRVVLAVTVCGGLVLLAGAVLRLATGDDHRLLTLGAAVFLLTPLSRNAAVLSRERRRAPLLLALVGTAALVAVYAWAASRLLVD